MGIPQGVLTCITGVAGSGKSSLVSEFLAAMRQPGRRGATVIDQKPVGRSSRSNPATYVGIFDAIRRTFASANGVKPNVFSFNGQGACPECKGHGFIDIEMSFLDDIRVKCQTCDGKRYRDEVLELTYHARSIHDVLEMTVTDAVSFCSSINDGSRRAAAITHGLQLLLDVGVGYLRLGQPLSTLSGGEAQRIKLASELTRTRNVYVMDEPTTGLHPTDIDRLLAIIARLIAEATPSSSSSTTSMLSSPPTGSSTSDRRAARTAGSWSRKARRKTSPRGRMSATPGAICRNTCRSA